jgi:hypothetical protein
VHRARERIYFGWLEIGHALPHLLLDWHQCQIAHFAPRRCAIEMGLLQAAIHPTSPFRPASGVNGFARQAGGFLGLEASRDAIEARKIILSGYRCG